MDDLLALAEIGEGLPPPVQTAQAGLTEVGFSCPPSSSALCWSPSAR